MRVRKRSRFWAATGLGAASLALGCASNSILFTTATRLGIEINPTEGGKQHAQVGYQRLEAVAMPVRRVEVDDAGRKTKKLIENAYSVYALHSYSTGTLLLGGLTTTKVHQVFATGQAAINASSSGAALEAFGIPACMPLADSDQVASELVAKLEDPDTRDRAIAAVREALEGGPELDTADEAFDLIEANRCTQEQLTRLQAARAALP